MYKKIKNKRKNNYKDVWVITSSIACGKSSFLKLAKENGIFCISADEISNKIFLKKYKQIARKLKIPISEMKFFDLKELKAKVASVIFKDLKAKKKLEKIMHKRIKKEIFKLIKINYKKIIFVEIPLFFENQNYNILLNKIIIYCPYEIALKRLMKRNNLSLAEAKLRMNSQINIEKKLKFATFLVNNKADFNEFINNSLKIINHIKDKKCNITNTTQTATIL